MTNMQHKGKMARMDVCSTLTALAVGVVIGFILGRRSNGRRPDPSKGDTLYMDVKEKKTHE